MTPRPESRISSLEKRATAIEAQIEELSSDQAENLKLIRQDIKRSHDDMIASFKQIGDTFIAITDTMATKEDLKALEAHIDRIEATMATKQDIAALEERLVDTMKQLWQHKPEGEREQQKAE